jgi:hypothetical protein
MNSDTERVKDFAKSLVAVEVDGHEDVQLMLPEGLGDDFLCFLESGNGGFTDDKVYHFFGNTGILEHNIHLWNRPSSWKSHFGLQDDFFVIAEDCVGGQYGYTLGKRRKVIKLLNMGDGQLSLAAHSFADFVKYTVCDGSMRPAWRDLIKRLEIKLGVPFQYFQHISARIPAVLGGNDSDLSNLEFTSSIDNLLFTGQILSQVKGLPSGTRIKDIIIDKDNKIFKLIY